LIPLFTAARRWDMTAISDAQLQANVLEELLFDPGLDAANVAATVQRGRVTLSGSVSNFPEKWATERAVKRVYGVEGVTDELVVTTLADAQQKDADIARAAGLPQSRVTFGSNSGTYGSRPGEP
jgi:hypothetical protein